MLQVGFTRLLEGDSDITSIDNHVKCVNYVLTDYNVLIGKPSSVSPVQEYVINKSHKFAGFNTVREETLEHVSNFKCTNIIDDTNVDTNVE